MLLKRVLTIFLLALGIIIIVIPLAIYQDIRYKSGQLTIIQKYEPNSQMHYEIAHYGVVNAKMDGKDIGIKVDSYGSGPIPSELKSSSHYYLAKDKYKVRRIASSSGFLKKGDVIEITYNGSMKE